MCACVCVCVCVRRVCVHALCVCVCVCECPDQCSLRACRKADRPSMMSRMPMVRTAQNAHSAKMMTQPMMGVAMAILKPYMVNTIFHSTSDNSVRGEGRRERETLKWKREKG